jgi:hypothetical protein
MPPATLKNLEENTHFTRPVQKDFGALPIDSTTGQAAPGGDIRALDTLASFGRTMLAAVGIPTAIRIHL